VFGKSDAVIMFLNIYVLQAVLYVLDCPTFPNAVAKLVSHQIVAERVIDEIADARRSVS